MARKKSGIENAAVDPLTLDVYPFDMGSIPFDRPVKGFDLEVLRKKLGLKVHDATWLLGMNINSWYAHTSYETEKVAKKSLRDRAKISEKILALEARAKVLEDEFSSASSDDRKKIQAEIDVIDVNLEKLNEKLKKTEVSQDVLKKAEKAEEEAVRGPDKPVKGTLALLVRFYDVMDQYVDRIRMRPPTIADLCDQAGISDREVGEMLGRDISAGYRWLESDVEPHPTVRRLVDCLVQWFGDEPFNENGLSTKDVWLNVVRREWALHGWELGKVKNPSEKTLPSKIPAAQRGGDGRAAA